MSLYISIKIKLYWCRGVIKCQAQELEIHKKHFEIINLKLILKAQNYCQL